MAKQFKTPTLPEITYEYLGLHRRRVRAADYERLQNTFLKVLTRTRDPEDIRAALKLDTSHNLPVQMKSPAYERLLSLEGRTPALLREYAQEMYDFGPAFQHYADQLWDEAKALDSE